MQNPNKMIVKNIVKDEVSLGLKAARLDTKSIEEKTEESLPNPSLI
jgi:energy-coupling factor transporter ATP-binding protein EcfA2